jgi:Cu2+-exporting ATPase
MKGTNATQADFEILHALPGRLRVRLPGIQYQPALALGLEHQLSQESGVFSSLANVACSSLTISFNPAIFDALAWLSQLDLTNIKPVEAHAIKSPDGHHEPGHAHNALFVVAKLPKPLMALRRRTFQFEKMVPPKAQFVLGAAAVAASILELPAIITGSIVVAATTPIVNRAAQSLLLEKRVGADALDSLTCGLLINSGNFFPAAVMTSLIGLGELMRHLITDKCQDLINHQLALCAKSAWLIKGHQKLRTPVKDLRPGDCIAIYPGEMVPCPGRISSGKATVVTATPDSDYAPRSVGIGDELDTGLLIMDGKVYLHSEPVSPKTAPNHLNERHQRRWLQHTRLHRDALKTGYKAVLPLVSVAGITYALTGSIERALSIMCFDFLTGVKIAIPTAVLASMYSCGNRGIVVKNASSLEALAEIDTVIFARSGILTVLKPNITEIKVTEGFTLEQVTVYAAAVERRYDNMAAFAIYNYAPPHKTPIPERFDSNHISGLGVEGTVEGHKVLVGRTRLMRMRGVDVSTMEDFLDVCQKRGDSRACVAIDGKLAAVISFYDPLRADVKEVVTALGELGISEIAMITGITESAAQAVAEKAGITRIHARTMPEDQAKIVREYKKRGRRVAVVGHDVDDILALEAADLAITLGNSSDVARVRADIVLTSENLSGLVEGIKIAREGMKLARQNIAIVTMPNFLGLGLAALGSENFLLATTLNNGSVILATTHGLKPSFDGGEKADEDEEDNETTADAPTQSELSVGPS